MVGLLAPRRRLGVVLVLLALVALALTGLVVTLTRTEWSVRYGSPGQPLSWSQAEWAYFAAGWVSVLLGQLGGLWLWWRAPRNATGRWLWLAGFSQGLWFVGIYWPSAWGMQLTWADFATLPALAMAILGWPTGRPGRAIVRWIVAVALATVTLSFVVRLFQGPSQPGTWPQDPLMPFSVAWVTSVGYGVISWLCYFLPPAAVIVVLIRRRRGVPPGARRLLTPIMITGILVAGSSILTAVMITFAQSLIWNDATNHATVLGTLNLVQNYGQVAVAVTGLLVAFSYRQRAVRAGTHRLELELGPTSSIDTSSTLGRLLGDPSARVLYPRPSGAWVDAQGGPVEVGQQHRVLTIVEDQYGSTLAAVETDGQVGVHPSLLEIGAATIGTSLTNERVYAMANARSTELAALQLALLHATDSARRRLEQDLHDGAQQRLVGVTLAAALSARDGDPAAAEDVRAEIAATRAAIVEVLEDRAPMVLTNGVASALTTLAATVPLDAVAHVRGDLNPSDPLARTVWLIASEASANAVKHANASMLNISFTADASNVILRINDDGCGGVKAPPRTIVSRVQEAGGELNLTSPSGGGTDLVVVFDRTGTLAA